MGRFIVLLMAMSACYSPSYRDCEVTCAAGACPSGLECVEGVCRPLGMRGPCGGGDASPPDASIKIEELTEAVVQALCAHQVRCGSAEDVATCAAIMRNLLYPRPELAAAVAAGRVTFDPMKAYECLDAVAAASCTRTSNFAPGLRIESCSRALQGMVGDGGTCLITEECISQVCMKPSSCPTPTTCCPGACVGSTAPGARNVGDSCSFQDTCVNSYCDFQLRVCIAYKANGATCASDVECGEGNMCRSSDGTTANRVCRPRVVAGGACTMTQDCNDLSNVCRDGICKIGGLAGTPCTQADHCQPQRYCPGSATMVGACALPPDIGDSCQSFGFCRSGYCRQTDYRCVARGANGDACNTQLNGNDCESRFCSAQGLCGAAPTCF